MSAFIDQQRVRFGVEFVCRTLGVSASAYNRLGAPERVGEPYLYAHPYAHTRLG